MAVSFCHGTRRPSSPMQSSTGQSDVTYEDQHALCTECQKLDIRASRFVISPGPVNEATSTPDSFLLHSTTTRIPFGTLAEIWDRRQGCNLCNLIACAVEQDENRYDQTPSNLHQRLGPSTCFLSWKVDGRHRINTNDAGYEKDREPSYALTRRIQLGWDNSYLQDFYLVLVGSDERLSTSDAERVWNSSLLFLGRRIGTRGRIQARMRSWIDLCLEKHRGPCSQSKEPRLHLTGQSMATKDLPKRLEDMLSHSYFGVIDVINMHLTELPLTRDGKGGIISLSEYAALSYVWGTASSYRTLLQNVMQHRMHGGLEKVFHRFPKAVQDAIKPVRQLGVQYIWIDSLCIIQDSARSWKLNAYNMDLIYGNAIFTICAADSPDASIGLLAMDKVSGTDNNEQLIASCAKDVRLMISRPPETYIEASTWNQRAWTFQERLLSRRCLIFAGGRAYFQCQSTGMSEDIYTDREGAGWSLDFTDAPLQTFQQLPLRSFWVYMKIVELYTARSLTRENDILAAFSGMSNVMEQTMRAPLAFGLPTSHLDLALLWDHLAPLDRRAPYLQTGSISHHVFPSWSWSGWTGKGRRYPRDMIAGCLDDPNEWLKIRTWIRWYMRDESGDLFPLWDEKRWEMDRSQHIIWRGYGHRRSSGARRFWTRGDTSHDMDASRISPWDDGISVHWKRGPLQIRPDLDLERYTANRVPEHGYTLGRFLDDIKPENKSEARDRASIIYRNRRPLAMPKAKDYHYELERPRHRDGYARKTVTGQKHAYEVQALKSEAPQQPRRYLWYTWIQRSRNVLMWLRDRYGEKVLSYWIEICLLTLELVTYLLGLPMEFERYPQQHDDLIGDIPRRHHDREGEREAELPYPDNKRGDNESEIYYTRTVQPERHIRRGRADMDYFSDAQAESVAERQAVSYYPGEDERQSVIPRNDGHTYQYYERAHTEIKTDVRQVRFPSEMGDRPRRIRSQSNTSSVASQHRRVHDMVFEEDYIVEPERTEAEPSFRITLKEFPYKPVTVPFCQKPEVSKVTMMPILQFWTWHSFLYIHSPPLDKIGVTRCNIADKFGDWCGSIMLDNKWLGNTETAKHEFIALSEAKRFTDEECEIWSYYIPKEREDSEWDLFFVMLIEWSDGRWERVGLGKVFKEAFRDATWKEIVLA